MEEASIRIECAYNWGHALEFITPIPNRGDDMQVSIGKNFILLDKGDIPRLIEFLQRFVL